MQRQDQTKRIPKKVSAAFSRYLAELEKVYPEGAEQHAVIPWPEYGEGAYVVKVPLLVDDEQWITVSERMAEVGTRILVESDQLFVLTA